MDITHLATILERSDVSAQDRMLRFLESADAEVLNRYATCVRREYPTVDSAIGYCPHVDADARMVTDTYMGIVLDRASLTPTCERMLTAIHRDRILSAAIAAGYAELVVIAVLSLYVTIESRQYRARAASAADSADSADT